MDVAKFVIEKLISTNSSSAVITPTNGFAAENRDYFVLDGVNKF